MQHRFRITGEYFDDKGEGAMVVGGAFVTLSMAKRAIVWLREYFLQPVPGKIPPELEEVAAVADEATLEIGLYVRTLDGNEEMVLSFDPDSGDPIDVTPNAFLVWSLVKKALRKD